MLQYDPGLHLNREGKIPQLDRSLPSLFHSLDAMAFFFAACFCSATIQGQPLFLWKSQHISMTAG